MKSGMGLRAPELLSTEAGYSEHLGHNYSASCGMARWWLMAGWYRAGRRLVMGVVNDRGGGVGSWVGVRVLPKTTTQHNKTRKATQNPAHLEPTLIHPTKRLDMYTQRLAQSGRYTTSNPSTTGFGSSA